MRGKQNKGFTIVELLLIITIIGILAALFITLGKVAIASAKDAKRKSNADDVRTALSLYYKDNQEMFPVIASPVAGGTPLGDLATSLTSMYLSDQSILQPDSANLTNKYFSTMDGGNYAIVYGLEKKTGGTVTSGDGVYQTNASTIPGSVSVGNFYSGALSYPTATAVTSGNITPDLNLGSYSLGNVVTASFWIKPTDTSHTSYLLNKMFSDPIAINPTDMQGWAVKLTPGTDATNGNVNFTLCRLSPCESPPAFTVTSTTNPIITGAWNHVVLLVKTTEGYSLAPTYGNHALAADTLISPVCPGCYYFAYIMIVNGTVVTPTSLGCNGYAYSCDAWIWNNTMKLLFGLGSTVGYSGLVDDIRIWKYALTKAQIDAVYNAGKGGYGSCATSTGSGSTGVCLNDPNLIGGWRLDEGSGNTTVNFVDSSLAIINMDRAKWVTTGVIPIGFSGILTGSSTYDANGRAYVLTSVK